MDVVLIIMLGIAFFAGYLFAKSFTKKKKSSIPEVTPVTTEWKSEFDDKWDDDTGYSGYLDYAIKNGRKIFGMFSPLLKPRSPTDKLSKISDTMMSWIYVIGGIIFIGISGWFSFLQFAQLGMVLAGVFLVIFGVRGLNPKKVETNGK